VNRPAVLIGGTHPDPDDPVWSAWLTEAELAYAAGRRRAGEHLAARRLAKLAALRALGWVGAEPWHELAVERPARGRPTLRLGGGLAGWCAARDLAVPGVSLTHAAGRAAALAWLPAAPDVGAPTRPPDGHG
jgi:holo-[acyl-carrier protein] synthase